MLLFLLQGAAEKEDRKTIDDQRCDREIDGALWFKRTSRFDPDMSVIYLCRTGKGELAIIQFALRTIEQLGHTTRSLQGKCAQLAINLLQTGVV